MKDHKNKLQQDVDDLSTITNVSRLAADGAGNVVDALPVARAAENSPYTLGRLEHDLYILQAKWRAVEHEIEERDHALASLRQELDSVNRLRETLTGEKEALARQLGENRDHVAGSLQRVSELESKNTALRLHVQELNDYIDRRKLEWDRLNDQVREYEDAIEGMQARISSQDEIVAGKNEEKAAVAARLIEVEQELAELTGRHREREESRAELRQALEDQSQELGSLNGEVIRLKKLVTELEAQLEQRAATISELNRSHEELQQQFEERESSLTARKREIAERREQQDERVRELELALRNSEAIREQLESRLAEKATGRDALESKASENEIRAAELNAMYLESESQRKNLAAELEAQRELVAQLENELSARAQGREAKEADADADRLALIGAELRELDFRIDACWTERPVLDVIAGSESAEQVAEPADEVLITAEELFEEPGQPAGHFLICENEDGSERARYPLVGNQITVGRSRRSDIRLDSKYISRHHARIKIDGDQAVIEDLGSRNGFFVNDKRVLRHTLAHGDEFELGLDRFRYEHVDPPEERPSPLR